MTAVAERDGLSFIGIVPEDFWDVNDDACDCTFQRIGFWTNPYIGETLEVRMCCIWAELYKLFPQHVRKTDAFFNYQVNQWETGQREWDGESDMPRSIWFRQLAKRYGRSLSDVRSIYQHMDAPKGMPKSQPETVTVNSTEVLFEMVTSLAEEVFTLKRKLGETE